MILVSPRPSRLAGKRVSKSQCYVAVTLASRQPRAEGSSSKQNLAPGVEAVEYKLTQLLTRQSMRASVIKVPAQRPTRIADGAIDVPSGMKTMLICSSGAHQSYTATGAAEKNCAGRRTV